MPRCVLCLVVALVLSQGTGCRRIEAKLERLAKVAGLSQEPPPAEPVLTAQQIELQRRLEALEVLQAPKAEEVAPKAPAFVHNKSALVSILGYHDFRERGGSPMLIAAGKFEQQMIAIKERGLPVIALNDVLRWRRGEINIPEESVVITMDDGWVGVYEHAFPVLKKMGFPFTVYLYQRYVGIGGRSLSEAQIREMMQHGCEIGSHSVSHRSLRESRTRGDDWLRSELEESRAFLREKFAVPCTSFAYPFGIFDDKVLQVAREVGYECLVTVNGQKVGWETPLEKFGRYIIHGENDSNFELAISFRGRGGNNAGTTLASDAKDESGRLLVELSPPAGSVVRERRPLLRANLSRLGLLLEGSVRMRVGGLGEVPAVWDAKSASLVYPLPIAWRRESCQVIIEFQRAGAAKPESLRWSFKVELPALYSPRAAAAEATGSPTP